MFKSEDIISTLQHLGVLRYTAGQHVIVATHDMIEKEYQRLNNKPGPVVDPARIHWVPFEPAVKKDEWLLKNIEKKMPRAEDDAS